MFFSIIIPAYNVQNYIKCCLDSILRQSCNDYEIILVNDGSSDDTGKICAEYSLRFDNIKLINKVNGGLSDARNSGIRIAEGEYILFVDGDDYIAIDSLENLKKLCLEQNSPDVCFLNAVKVYRNGKIALLDEKLDESKVYNHSKYDVLDYISSLRKYPGSACTKLVKRTIIVDNNCFFKMGVKSEDLDWTRCLLFLSSSFGYCDCDYYNYRQNRIGSITNTIKYENFKDLEDVIKLWIHDSETLNEKYRSILLRFACYEYKILLVLATKLDTEYDEKVDASLNNLKYLLKFNDSFQTKMLKYLISILSLRKFIKLLKIYTKHRGI